MAGEVRALATPTREALSRAPLVLAVAGLAGAAVYVGHGIATDTAPIVAAAISIQSATYLIGGAIAWSRRPDYLLGPLLLLAGYLSLVNALIRIEAVPHLWAIGASYQGIYEAVLAYLVLTYPSGRPSRTPWGVIAVGIVVASFLGTTFRLLTADAGLICADSGYCPAGPNPFRIWDVGLLAWDVLDGLTRVMAVLVVVLAGWRYVAARGAARRVLLPVLAAGAILAAWVVSIGLLMGPGRADELYATGRLGEILFPAALLVGFLRSRMARAGVADLVIGLGPAPNLIELERALRRALHDESAQLFVWSPSLAGYVDTRDQLVRLPVMEVGRQLTEVRDGERPIAAIVHDPILVEEGDLVSAVSASVRIVLQNRSLATTVRSQADDMARLPRGPVTLLYTDVEDSTRLLDQLADRYVDVLGDLRRLLREVTRRAGGMEIDSRADEFFAAIPDPSRAARAALEAQAAVRAHAWPDGVLVRVRIGLHFGEPTLTDEGYVGLDVHLAARVGAAGHGGQIVVSEAARAAVQAVAADRHVFVDLGAYTLHGISEPQRLAQLMDPGEVRAFAPLRAPRATTTPL